MIYYDITDLFDHFRHASRVTGIQRVSIATISRLSKLAKANDVQLIAFHTKLQKTVVCDLNAFPLEEASGATISKRFGFRYKGPHPLDAYLTRRYKSAAKRFVNKWRLIAGNVLSGGKTLRRKGLYYPASGGSGNGAVWREPNFTNGDVVLLSGSYRVKDRFLDDLSKARAEKGLRLAQFIQDVLPLTEPQFFPRGAPYQFADWLTRINSICDLVLVTTELNKRDYETVIRQHGETPHPSIRVVPLAHEFIENTDEKTGRPTYQTVSTPVLMAASLPFVLCVGTREIRKNNLGLARVWDRLEKTRGLSTPRLVFAGRQGWLNEECEQFLKRTSNVNGYIVIADNISDEEVAFLYKKSLFSVFPSFAEGWGLPIGESLWFGRPVVTSNISSMPNVAGDYADYANPYDLVSLQAAVERLLEPQYRQTRIEAIKSLNRRRWDDFADDLWRELEKLHNDKALESLANSSRLI